jgi:acetylornithine deacetylase/succinyl-diaminopimelate desuccinylase-like protein
MDFVEACRKLISLDSTPEQGNRSAALFAAELCQSKGLFVEKIEEISGDLRQMNLIARPQSERPAKEIMFQTHLDTADPGPFALWTETGHNPFDAHIIDGKIFGIGAADTKLDFLCKLEAISSFDKDTKWRTPPVLVGTFGEETGMTGALKLIRKNKVSTEHAFIGEPSDLHLVTSGKGMAAVEVRVPYDEDEKRYRIEHNLKESTSTQSRIFSGKSAHSSTPHKGESAIKKMLQYLLQMPEDITVMEIDGGVNYNTVPANAFLELDLVGGYKSPMAKKIAAIYKAVSDLEDEFLQYQDEEFDPPYPTLNVGIIRTFSDHVFLSGTCRLPPLVTHEVYEKWMAMLGKVCQSVRADFRITDYKRPFRTEKRTPFIDGCLEELRHLHLSEKIVTQPSTNEASLFVRVGIECVCFGAGKREGNIHTPHEHVLLEDLKKSTEFYRRVIQRFCL